MACRALSQRNSDPTKASRPWDIVCLLFYFVIAYILELSKIRMDKSCFSYLTAKQLIISIVIKGITTWIYGLCGFDFLVSNRDRKLSSLIKKKKKVN